MHATPRPNISVLYPLVVRTCIPPMSKERESTENSPSQEVQKPRNRAVELDRGEELLRYRKRWWQLW